MNELATLEQAYAELTWFESHGGMTEMQAQILADVKYQLAVYYMRPDV